MMSFFVFYDLTTTDIVNNMTVITNAIGLISSLQKQMRKNPKKQYIKHMLKPH